MTKKGTRTEKSAVLPALFLLPQKFADKNT